jgi:hypothetical protein
MNRHFFSIVLTSTFTLGAGCGSSAIGGRVENEGTSASSSASVGEVSLPGRPCTPSNTSMAPADGFIADFAEAGSRGIEISGGIVTYPAPKVGGPSSPGYTIAGGALTVTVNVSPTSKPQFVGALVSFDKCIDASAFSGVQFTISGSLSGCQMQYATGDVAHQDITLGSRYASGPAGAYPPQFRIAADDLTSTSRTIKAPFARPDIRGNPATAFDPTKLIFTLWQFTVPVAPEDDGGIEMCTGSVTIDDVRFYR